MMEVERYEAGWEREWNDFVAASKSGTFLLDRRYMDYHADRFADSSLMVWRDGHLFALLPACRKGDTLFSHAGLTYGGLLTGIGAGAADVLEAFRAINAWLRAEGVGRVVYKAVPWIYHRQPAEEDLYALFAVCGARLVARDISSAIVMASAPKWSRDRRYGINRCRNNGVTVERSDDYAAFWPVLEANLMASHGVRPVHTLDEMLLLKGRFPQNIQLYVARREGRVLGGTVLYLTPQVTHAQYISASPEGKALRVIDAIYDKILHEDFLNVPYFDFGKSTEDYGRVLNASLIHQKEGFGGRGVCYDWYEWKP